MKKVFNIVFDGNIGSGKTTTIQSLQDYILKNNIDADVVLEPVDEWQKTQDSSNNNILEYYYQDPKKYSFAFQINALLSRIKKVEDILKYSKKQIHFIERSIFTDKNVFLEVNFQKGNISEIEYVIYHQWFDWILSTFKHKIDGIVYLNTSAKICYQRINQRNRKGEESIPMDYLVMLEKFHINWLKNETVIPVTFIDTNVNFFEFPEKKNEVINIIMKMVDDILTNKIRLS